MLERRHFARSIRIARKIHRTMGIVLFALFIVVAVTGLLLGWKKHSGGLILPRSHTGVSTDMTKWLSIDELTRRAFRIAREKIDPDMSLALERIDIRPEKGMVKYVFLDAYWGVQLDCTTGELLHIERRRSDFIENIHDGSIFDHYLGTSNEQIKVACTTVGGSALLMFSVTGFWLWVGPKRLRAGRRASRTTASSPAQPRSDSTCTPPE
ncbi:MAG: PepSY domain-containing protein [Candidatus Hydrogenedentes bacterium]|nr:PepSY domain-containing protein [Candidatus Hydrogenedentota bacterium]